MVLNTELLAIHSISKENAQGTSETEPSKNQVWGKLMTKLLKGGYSLRVPCQIKIKCGLFVNQACKFMDREWLCVPWPAPKLCVRQQLLDLAAPWAGRALLLAAPKVGMQGFLQFLTWIQSPFSWDQQCSRSSAHFHSTKLYIDTREALKAGSSLPKLFPHQALLPEDRIPWVGFREFAGPWQDEDLSLEEPKFLYIPEMSWPQHTQSVTNHFCPSESPKITVPIAHGLSQSCFTQPSFRAKVKNDNICLTESLTCACVLGGKRALPRNGNFWKCRRCCSSSSVTEEADSAAMASKPKLW